MKTNLRYTKRDVLRGAVMAFIKIQRKIAREEFVKINLTEGKPKILDFLQINSGCSQKEIGKNCHIEPATVTSLLSTLEAESLITRECNASDKRVINVFLTKKGKLAQEEVKKPFAALENNASITSQTSAPIYIKYAKNTYVILAVETENVITDTANYVLEDATSNEPNVAR